MNSIFFVEFAEDSWVHTNFTWQMGLNVFNISCAVLPKSCPTFHYIILIFV